MLLIAAALGYGAVRGQHVPAVTDWLKDARDVAANSLGFRIAAISLAGEKEVSREEVLTTAGVTGRASLLFLDADAARARLMANPWIADAAVLKLYPDRLQITITERLAFALWQKDGHVSVIAADGTVLEPFVEDRYLGLPLVVGAGAERQAKDFLAVLDRYPDIRAGVAGVDPGGRAALESAADQRHRRAPAGNQCRRRARSAGRARSRQEAFVARHHDGRSAPAGSRDRAPVGCGGAGPRRGAQGQYEEEEGRRRMNALRYGLTPKMKPISPRRSALVAALDVGSSKVVCLIARLRPHGPQQVLTRRSHAIEVIGFGHTVARGMKAGSVVNLAQGRGSHPPGRR